MRFRITPTLQRLAFLIALFALVAGAIEQRALDVSVLWAATHDRVAGADDAPDMQGMPADCPMHAGNGHTHRGHADCALCGALGAISWIAAPPAIDLPPRDVFSRPRDIRAESLARPVGAPTPYAPRGPPAAMI